VIEARLHSALKAQGLRRRGRTWWEGDDDRGWVLLALSRDKHNEGDRVEFSVGPVVWPPGTWATYRELGYEHPHPEPVLNAPLSTDRTWTSTARTDEAVAYAVEVALPLARAHVDVDTALHALRERPAPWLPLAPVWSLISACGMLERAAPEHPQRAATVRALDALWTADPRPEFLASVLERWRGP
jgi:hypothetical protein